MKKNGVGRWEKQKDYALIYLYFSLVVFLFFFRLKVRGHTLVWSVPRRVQDWVKQLNGQELRDAVNHHIQETMNMTQGL